MKNELKKKIEKAQKENKETSNFVDLFYDADSIISCEITVKTSKKSKPQKGIITNNNFIGTLMEQGINCVAEEIEDRERLVKKLIKEI